MSNVPDYYAVLGVSQDASADEIRSAFKALARQYSSASEPGARQLKEAYDILMDDTRRQQYDTYLMRQGSSGSGLRRLGSTSETMPASAAAPPGALVGSVTPAQVASGVWEYLTLKSSRNYGTTKYYINEVQERDLKNARFSDVINQIGRDGWEMVGIAVDGHDQTYIFKRLARD